MCHRYIWGSRGNTAWMEEGTGGHRCGSRSQVSWKLKMKVASVLSSSLQHYRLYPPGSSVPGDSPGQARTLEWIAKIPPGDLPNPGITHRSPALQVDSLPSEPPPWNPWTLVILPIKWEEMTRQFPRLNPGFNFLSMIFKIVVTFLF